MCLLEQNKGWFKPVAGEASPAPNANGIVHRWMEPVSKAASVMTSRGSKGPFEDKFLMVAQIYFGQSHQQKR